MAFLFHHRHYFLVFVLFAISQSFSPSLKPHYAHYTTRHLPITPSSPTAPLTWNILILFSSNSLALAEEPSSPLPKFDSAFAEAIGKPLKKWKNENEGKKKKASSSSPLSLAELKTEKLSTPMKQILAELEKADHADEGQDEEDQNFPEEQLHPDIIKYREEQLQKHWFELRLKIEQRMQKRSFFENITVSKAVVDLEKRILGKSSVTEKELTEFIEEEKKLNGRNKSDLFNLFPELKAMLPKFVKTEEGGLVSCKADEECPFPLTCCPAFVSTGDRFCCSGWGERAMMPAYELSTVSGADKAADPLYPSTTKTYCPYQA